MTFKVLNFKAIGDERGWLVPLEGNKNIPFEIKRVYYIFGTQEAVHRGFHAHINLQQMVICVKGSCKFLLDDGVQKQIIKLDHPEQGLYIKDIVWREMYDFSPDCVLVVLTDKYYDVDDYIKDYNEFKSQVGKN